jgi:CHASE2 domain-containing sensor protein
MSKVVVIELDGDLLQQGFRVSLEIKEEGRIDSLCRRKGKLPPDPKLSDRLEYHWQEIYRNLAASYRIKNKQIISKSFLQSLVEKCHQSSVDLKNELNNWLKSEEFREIDVCIREQLKLDEDVRFLIHTDDQELQKLPWQEWDIFTSYSRAEIGWALPNYQLPRSIKNHNLKVRLLVILGNRQGIDIETDKLLLQSLPNVDLVFLDEPHRREINDELWEKNWDIIFFAGHSRTKSETGTIDINPHDSLSIDELCYGLKKAIEKGLKLAIFNSCDGLGLARSLYNLNIPQTIVMRELVPDQVAHEFLKSFLKKFAQGKSLYIAVREAREQLQGLEDKFPCATWLPVIFQNPAVIPPTWHDLIGIKRQTPQVSQIKFLHLLLTSFVFTGLVMGVRSLGILQPLELKAYDHFLRMLPDKEPDPHLVIVKVTEADIQEFAQDPISDRLILKALENINQHQPIAIGLDILRNIPLNPGNQELNSYLQENPNIVTICKFGHPQAKTKNDLGLKPPPGSPQTSRSFNNINKDPDNIVRRQLIYATPTELSYCQAKYSFSSQLAFRFLNSKGISPESVIFNRLHELRNKNGFYQQIDDKGYQILLNYRSSGKVAAEISLSQIINNDFEPQLLGNKIVLIGYTTESTKPDVFLTPYTNHPQQKKMFGVEIHAQMTSQLISIGLKETQQLGFLPWWGDGICILLVSFSAWIPILYLKSSLHQTVVFAINIIVLYYACFLYLITAPLIPAILVLALLRIFAPSLLITSETEA